MNLMKFIDEYMLSIEGPLERFNPCKPYVENIFRPSTPSFIMTPFKDRNKKYRNISAEIHHTDHKMIKRINSTEPFIQNLSIVTGVLNAGLFEGDIDYSTLSMYPRSAEEIVVKFNMSLPIDPQLNAIKELLAEEYNFLLDEGLIDSTSARKSSNDYNDYLRVFDAIESGTEKKIIADEFFPGLSKHENVKTDSPGQRKVTNYYEAAKKLSQKGWKRLLWLK
ncbi:MAG: hypothetical protein HQL97_05005 [Magnetococcales bacterium]|nr:hypothetical protein [Magnetococcales bacterium]